MRNFYQLYRPYTDISSLVVEQNTQQIVEQKLLDNTQQHGGDLQKIPQLGEFLS